MRLDMLTNEKIASYFADDSFPKYAIIRNPVIRTLSGYINSIENKEQNAKDGLTDPQAFQLFIQKRFPANYSYLVEHNLVSSQNRHFRSQLNFCAFRQPDFRVRWHVFKFEQPEKFTDYIYSIVPHQFLDNGWGPGLNISFREYETVSRSRSHNPDARFAEYIVSMESLDHLVKALDYEIKYLGYEKEVAALRKNMQLVLPDIRKFAV